jgi:hypothetical protein
LLAKVFYPHFAPLRLCERLILLAKQLHHRLLTILVIPVLIIG